MTKFKKNNAQHKYGTQQKAEAILNSMDTSQLSISLKNIIKNCSYFFLATSSKDAKPSINFKGGERGFVHILDNKTVIFPDYEGNGIFHGVNDMMENPNIAMLFIDFVRDVRYKVSGVATIIDKHEEISQYLDLKGFDYPSRVIKVDVTYVLGNCPRYLGNVRKDIISFEQEWESPCGHADN